mgnify:CR=1 FL=1
MQESVTPRTAAMVVPTPAPDALAGRRVLIVVENLPVPLDRRVWQEATTLVAHGAEVSVICPAVQGWDRLHEVIEGVHIWRHPLPEASAGLLAYAREYGSALWHWFRLARRIRRERGFDVIHGCNPPDLVWVPALWHRLRGVAYIFDHHDVCPELYEAKFGRRGPAWVLMRVLERLNFAAATVSIATNDSFARIARTRGGMAPEDVFTVRSGPRLNRFVPGPGNRALRAGAETVLGWVGVIGRQEGLELLVAAMARLVAQGRSLHAVIVGFGPHLPAIRAEVTAHGLDGHFTFTGPLFGDDLVAALNACDIGVSPDPRNAMNDISTMNKVLEFMALEKPVVQFDLTEGRASAGDAALYATPNDPADLAACIARLIDDPGLARRMGRIGRARVTGAMTWEHQVPALIAAYRRALEKRGLVTAEQKKGAATRAATPGAVPFASVSSTQRP